MDNNNGRNRNFMKGNGGRKDFQTKSMNEPIKKDPVPVVEQKPVGKKFYGVLTGIKYSDLDVKKNQLPECVFETDGNLTDKGLEDRCFVEQIDRKCSDCRSCSSYNYI